MESKEMAWLPVGSPDSEKILHIRHNGRWTVYSSTPYAVPDTRFAGHFGKGSKGFATMQKLLRLHWVLVPSDRASASRIPQGAIASNCSECPDINEWG